MAFEHSRIPSNPKRKCIMHQIYLVRYKYLMSDQGNYLCIIVTHTNNLTHILLDVALSTLYALGHLPCKNCCIRFIYCNILYHSNVRHIVYETMVIRVQSRPKRNEAVRLISTNNAAQATDLKTWCQPGFDYNFWHGDDTIFTK